MAPLHACVRSSRTVDGQWSQSTTNLLVLIADSSQPRVEFLSMPLIQDTKRLQSMEAEINHQVQRLADLHAEWVRLQEHLSGWFTLSDLMLLRFFPNDTDVFSPDPS